MNYLDPAYPPAQIGQIGILALAHVGDGVYNLLVRTYLLSRDHTASFDLHRTTVQTVNAGAQAQAYTRIAANLTEEEASVFRRGRNAKVNQVPHHATSADYHTATGLEALFGWLYLSGRQARINELFEMMMKSET